MVVRKAGIMNLNPQRQLFWDLNDLIERKRDGGYRPVLMMDTNGDHQSKQRRAKGLANFIQMAGFVDHYQDKSPVPIRETINHTKNGTLKVSWS